ncbi:Chaperone atp11p [Operophtera brumata]|uniref:Chaperone atp11p n=1 Tax=Operophtera brumata TaxID=104452 RepID=A0A0L7KNQ0_OPEBR|nr:Chaperone atp11p [Operophtera brumata]
MEKALENLQNNPFYEKYSARISKLQKTSPEEQFSSVLNPKTSQADGHSAEEKKLSDIFKVDLVKDKDGAEIKVIWEEYHKLKEVISATIPLQQYSDIQGVMKNYPTFLFPLPRAQGYEFMLCQCRAHSVHFTPLLAYQVTHSCSPCRAPRATSSCCASAAHTRCTSPLCWHTR